MQHFTFYRTINSPRVYIINKCILWQWYIKRYDIKWQEVIQMIVKNSLSSFFSNGSLFSVENFSFSSTYSNDFWRITGCYIVFFIRFLCRWQILFTFLKYLSAFQKLSWRGNKFLVRCAKIEKWRFRILDP